MHVSALLHQMLGEPEQVLYFARTLIRSIDNDVDLNTIYGACTYYTMFHHFGVSIMSWTKSEHQRLLLREIRDAKKVLAAHMQHAQTIQ